MNDIRRPALRYFGGKWRIGPWIISHFPEHYTYVEPFGGGASVLLQKKPAVLEVYNDLDEDVVTFFRVLRDQPDALIRAINYTPFSRTEYDGSFLPVKKPWWTKLSKKSKNAIDVEIARRLYVRSFQSYGSHTSRKSGWRFEKNKQSNRTAIGSWNSEPLHLEHAAQRLRQVQIERDDALKIIDRYDTPNTLFYLDPPYIEEVLNSAHRYRHTMTRKQHIELLTKIRHVQGMVIISMMEHEIYTAMLQHWPHDYLETITQNGKYVREYIWMSPNIQERQKQLTMFEEMQLWNTKSQDE